MTNKQLRQRIKDWFRSHSEKHEMKDITYAFSGHGYTRVKQIVNDMEKDGELVKRKVNDRRNQYWLNKEQDMFSRFFTMPTPMALTERI